MRITIQIDVPGAEGEGVSVTTTPGTTTTPGAGGEQPDQALDAGQPPASILAAFGESGAAASDGQGLVDAGPAPAPPAGGEASAQGEGGNNMADAEDAGGPPAHPG